MKEYIATNSRNVEYSRYKVLINLKRLIYNTTILIINFIIIVWYLWKKSI